MLSVLITDKKLITWRKKLIYKSFISLLYNRIFTYRSNSGPTNLFQFSKANACANDSLLKSRFSNHTSCSLVHVAVTITLANLFGLSENLQKNTLKSQFYNLYSKLYILTSFCHRNKLSTVEGVCSFSKCICLKQNRFYCFRNCFPSNSDTFQSSSFRFLESTVNLRKHRIDNYNTNIVYSNI